MGRLDSWDLVCGDRLIGRRRGRAVIAVPPDPAQDVLADEEVALLQPRGDDSGQAGAETPGHRLRWCLAEDALEVHPRELPARDLADDGKDVSGAVPDLLVTVTVGPAVDPWWAALRIEEVSDELRAEGLAPGGAVALSEAFDDLRCLGDRPSP